MTRSARAVAPASNKRAATETVVHLVRHAEVHNPDAVIYGQAAGFPLTARGHATAELLASKLSSNDVVSVLSSPLERAQQTAAPLARRLGLPVTTDERLIEARHVHEGQRVSMERSILVQPRLWASLRNPLRPSWGEPFLEVLCRMWAAVAQARAMAEGHEVVLVSHQVPIWLVRRVAEGRRLPHNPRRRQCALGSVTSLHFADTQIDRIGYSETTVQMGLEPGSRVDRHQLPGTDAEGAAVGATGPEDGEGVAG